MRRQTFYAALVPFLLFIAIPGVAPAQAASANTTFTVTLTITANCTISAANLNFGSHGVLATAFTGNSNVSVTCSNTTPYTVGLSVGTGTGSTFATRYMNGTTAGNTTTTVAYQLYQPGSTTVVWGDTGASDRVGGTGNGTAQTLTINGSVPAQTTPAPDTYSSTVTATVYF